MAREHGSHLPSIEVIWDSEAVAVSGEVVPLVHVNPVSLVGHHLEIGAGSRYVGRTAKYCIR